MAPNDHLLNGGQITIRKDGHSSRPDILIFNIRGHNSTGMADPHGWHIVYAAAHEKGVFMSCCEA